MKYSMLIQWSDRDNKYLVRLPEWENSIQTFFTHGDTYEEAARNGKECLELLVQDSQNLPAPQTAEYEWTDEDEKRYNASPSLILTGNDDDDAERYQASMVNNALTKDASLEYDQ
jgi:antitoxin HicB